MFPSGPRVPSLAARAAARQSPRVMPDSRTEKLAAFVAWTQAYITGDEKGQAQIFLDRLFRAFGHAGSFAPIFDNAVNREAADCLAEC